MSTSLPLNQRKRCAVDEAGGEDGVAPPSKRCPKKDDSAAVSSMSRFDNLPAVLRHRILEYSTVEDLSNVSLVSRQWRQDRCHKSLPQIRVATVDCRTCLDFIPVLLCIRGAEACGVFFKFKRLRIINHAGINKITSKQGKPITRGLRLQATSLDLSLSPSVLQAPKRQRQLPACVPRQLSEIMPKLIDVDLSCVRVTQSALSDFARRCPKLEKLRWDYCDSSSAFASGQDLKKCRKLKELYMDHACFYVGSTEQEDLMFEIPDATLCPLYFCKDKLERVSLVDASYYVYCHRGREDSKPFTQLGLMKFVRAATNLRWFRSDLTASNVEILKQERPEIIFV